MCHGQKKPTVQGSVSIFFFSTTASASYWSAGIVPARTALKIRIAGMVAIKRVTENVTTPTSMRAEIYGATWTIPVRGNVTKPLLILMP